MSNQENNGSPRGSGSHDKAGGEDLAMPKENFFSKQKRQFLNYKFTSIKINKSNPSEELIKKNVNQIDLEE